MKIRDYLKEKLIYFCTIFLSMLFIFCVLTFLNINTDITIFILLLYTIINLPYIIIDLIKRKRFYDNFKKLLNELDKKYLINEIVNKHYFLEADILLEYLTEINKAYNDSLCNYKYLLEEFKEYLELWCHEIKTPIATSKLIVLNNKNNITSSIDEELSKIEYYVEQVMYYARSENVENDYSINKISLNSVINNVIKDNKKSLLTKKIKINKFEENIIVESDSKWLSYIINQIILNSIKYSSNNPKISFNYIENKNNIILNITDNGIGIDEEDINRIFDKGFTGKNGRLNNKSTGMGLYLSKKLCTKLGHNIKIESVKNKYTTISIIFPINSYNKNITEM